MGGEWLFCDAKQNDYTGRNDHKIRTTLSPHVPFSSNTFVAKQKYWPPEAEIHQRWISHLSVMAFSHATSPQRGAFCC